ncbi:FAD-binding oxidoreductase [Streptomyces coelicoflavus]|uniref:FAD-binding oxidoreductase n=1 Tax=Streptomyces coelicoflavus TaxID=285562 RepID=UPI003319A9CD
MTRTTRRRAFLGATAATGAAVAATGLTAPSAQALGRTAADAASEVLPGGPQYGDLVRGVNQRWIGTPDRVVVPHTTEQVVTALRRALDAGERLAVRGGGHCFEDFSAHRDVRRLIDLSAMDDIRYDAERRAIRIGAGATLGEVNEQLFKRWGIALPGGSCPTVGLGGHVTGGGYGPLNRTLGLIVDHLYAVEVVVADEGGRPRAVVAARDSADPRRRDLWWAHTGGGGGNFGIVTRYWFRSRGLTGRTPQETLPTPPREVLVGTVLWQWADLDERSFTRLLKNYAAWHVAHNAPGDAQADLYSHLAAFHRSGGAVALNIQVSAARSAAGGPSPEERLDAFVAAVGAGVGARGTTVARSRLPWLLSTQWSGFADRPSGKRIKGKSAYHKEPFDDAQAEALYRGLTRADYRHPGSGVLIAPYGGQVNSVRSAATALPHRDSALMLMYVSEWTDQAEDDLHVGFLRELYESTYARNGGVPEAGAYINYPDADVRDARRNRSGVPWYELYYGPNYPELQRIKKAWDPRNVFRHRLSIELPSAARATR